MRLRALQILVDSLLVGLFLVALYMPERITRVNTPSRLDQVVAYLRAHSSVEVVDLRGDLLAAKTRQRVYYITDTHWDQFGAFVGAQHILAKLHDWYPQIEPLQETDYQLVDATTGGGDLAGMLALQGVLHEDVQRVIPRQPLRAHEVPVGYTLPDVPEPNQPIAREIPGSTFPRAVVMRDSYAVSLVPFLSERFSRVVYVEGWYLDLSVVDREHPDVVIQEIVERAFSMPPFPQ